MKADIHDDCCETKKMVHFDQFISHLTLHFHFIIQTLKFGWISAKGGGSEWKIHRTMFLIYVESNIEGKTGPTRLTAQDQKYYNVGIIIINCFLSSFFPLIMFTEKSSHMQQIFIKGFCFLSCSWWDLLFWRWGFGCASTLRLCLCSTAKKPQTHFSSVSTTRTWAAAQRCKPAFVDRKCGQKILKVHREVGVLLTPEIWVWITGNYICTA